MNKEPRQLLGRWFSCIAFIVLFGLLLAGCEPRSHMAGEDISEGSVPNSAQDTPPADAKECVSNAGNYVVHFVTTPDPIPLNEMFSIRFWVTPKSADDAATDALDIAVDARMPQHHHGMYRQPKVTSLGGGCYEATGLLFHMPGYWELYFDISHAGMTERAQAPVEID